MKTVPEEATGITRSRESQTAKGTKQPSVTLAEFDAIPPDVRLLVVLLADELALKPR